MEWFRHPHLTRGIVHTKEGSFAIHRGLVLVPDEIGERYGWLRVDMDGDSSRVEQRPESIRTAASMANHGVDFGGAAHAGGKGANGEVRRLGPE